MFSFCFAITISMPLISFRRFAAAITHYCSIIFADIAFRYYAMP